MPDNSTILVSSKLTDISCSPSNLTFYGIKGSYAESFAEENNHKFIPIPAITKSLPESVVAGEVISVDAIGINTQYKWYGTNDKNEIGTAIDGATENKFIPDNTFNMPFKILLTFSLLKDIIISYKAYKYRKQYIGRRKPNDIYRICN